MSFDWDASAAVTAYRRAGAAALTDAAEHILETANRTAPIEETTLIRSGTVTPATPRDLTAVVSYDTPYAVVQHEDTTFRHDPGREAKWLQRAMTREAARVGQYLADRMRRALP